MSEISGVEPLTSLVDSTYAHSVGLHLVIPRIDHGGHSGDIISRERMMA